MASYPGRRAPNVSQYIANLNVVRPERENAVGQDDAYSFEDDLNMFTNAEFLDYPVDEASLEQSVLDYNNAHEERSSRASAVAKKEYPHGLDLVTSTYTLVL